MSEGIKIEVCAPGADKLLKLPLYAVLISGTAEADAFNMKAFPGDYDTGKIPEECPRLPNNRGNNIGSTAVCSTCPEVLVSIVVRN